MQFDEHLFDILYGFNCHGTSGGASAIAEVLVACTAVTCCTKYSGNWLMLPVFTYCR